MPRNQSEKLLRGMAHWDEELTRWANEMARELLANGKDPDTVSRQGWYGSEAPVAEAKFKTLGVSLKNQWRDLHMDGIRRVGEMMRQLSTT